MFQPMRPLVRWSRVESRRANGYGCSNDSDAVRPNPKCSVTAKHNLDRFWRNARTHTLHDPARWKYHLIGNFVLNGVKPARHAWN